VVASSNARKNTAIEQVKKVFQSMENFQNGFGFDSSKMNKAPPIGAPKAHATPPEAPAAINCLFL
jgi:hypothetical protein